MTVCLCFVSNLISFHIARRIGTSCKDANPTLQTTLAQKRLNGIVEQAQKELLTHVQRRFRGWRVRRHIFAVLPVGHAWNARCKSTHSDLRCWYKRTNTDSAWDARSMRWAMTRRRAGKVVLRAFRLVHAKQTWRRIGALSKHLYIVVYIIYIGIK